MEIAPRYEGPAIMTVAADAAELGAALVRQRRRLLATLASLDDASWQAPSRCAGWSVQDVAIHLDGVNQFWHLSIAGGLAGTPSQLLRGFDPKATPAAMVDATRAASPEPSETLAVLETSSEALCEQVLALDDRQWAMLAEAPAGHIPILAITHHALWDCWVHERDIALPLGLPVVEEDDEVMGSLRYVAGLGPALALLAGRATPATLVLETTAPEGRIVVEVTDDVAVHDGPPPSDRPATVVLRDRAVDLTEALSTRAPLTHPVPEENRWLVTTLVDVFG